MEIVINSLNLDQVRKEVTTAALQRSETLSEAASIMGICPQTLYKYIRIYEIPKVLTQRFSKPRLDKTKMIA